MNTINDGGNINKIFLQALFDGSVAEYDVGNLVGFHRIVPRNQVGIPIGPGRFVIHRDGSYEFRGIQPFTHTDSFACRVEQSEDLVYVAYRRGSNFDPAYVRNIKDHVVIGRTTTGGFVPQQTGGWGVPPNMDRIQQTLQPRMGRIRHPQRTFDRETIYLRFPTLLFFGSIVLTAIVTAIMNLVQSHWIMMLAFALVFAMMFHAVVLFFGTTEKTQVIVRGIFAGVYGFLITLAGHAMEVFTEDTVIQLCLNLGTMTVFLLAFAWGLWNYDKIDIYDFNLS